VTCRTGDRVVVVRGMPAATLASDCSGARSSQPTGRSRPQRSARSRWRTQDVRAVKTALRADAHLVQISVRRKLQQSRDARFPTEATDARRIDLCVGRPDWAIPLNAADHAANGRGFRSGQTIEKRVGIASTGPSRIAAWSGDRHRGPSPAADSRPSARSTAWDCPPGRARDLRPGKLGLLKLPKLNS